MDDHLFVHLFVQFLFKKLRKSLHDQLGYDKKLHTARKQIGQLIFWKYIWHKFEWIKQDVLYFSNNINLLK